MSSIGNAMEVLTKYSSAEDKTAILPTLTQEEETPASATDVMIPPTFSKKTIQQYVTHIMLQADGLN